jgi:hypothetical protein
VGEATVTIGEEAEGRELGGFSLEDAHPTGEEEEERKQ